MLACVLLNFFKKKPNVYLRSDGYGEYKAILGFLGLPIYHMMFFIVSKFSHLISCREYILRGRKEILLSHLSLLVNGYQIHKTARLDKIKILYVGRIRVEKGIFSLLKIFKKLAKI